MEEKFEEDLIREILHRVIKVLGWI